MNSIIFPGQGSQKVGMGRKIFDSFLAAREVFQEVDDSLSQHLSKIILEGPNDILTLTENTQPAVMCVSMAMIRVLQKEFDINLGNNFSYLAGHSLGEYTSLAAAESLSISDVAKLLKIRGKSMQKAVSPGNGSMAAIMGGSLQEIKQIINKSINGDVCEIANHNTYSQIVISGDKVAIDRAISLSKEEGYKAVKLAVSAPFHCSHMRKTAEELKIFFEKINFNEPKIKIINNYSARPCDSLVDLKNQLCKQTFSMVKWYDTILYMKEKGVVRYLEIGFGNTLSGMLKRIDKNLISKNFNEPTDFENFAKELL